MMAAFPIWNERIAPVFDTATRVRLVHREDEATTQLRDVSLADLSPFQKAARLAELGVGVLVCGAISRPLYAIVQSYGIEVVPHIAGDIEEVIAAWLNTEPFPQLAFAMPGCRRGPRGRQRMLPNFRQEDFHMFGKRQMGGGSQGCQGKGKGRMGGPKHAGPSGSSCVCPSCGHHEPHEQGIPCNQKKCPKCGSSMTRE